MVSGTASLAPALKALSQQEVDTFNRDGFHLARQVFSKQEIDTLRDTFMAANANGPVQGLSELKHHAGGDYDRNDPLSFYPRMMHPHRHPENPVGPLSLKTMLDPRLEAILSDLFADEPIAAQTMFYFKPPGARGQDFHQDNFYLRVQPGTCMAAWVAVDDCDMENGAMMVVPMSNAMDIQCPEKADSKLFFTTEHVAIPAGYQAIPCNMKAGDVLFFNGSIIHGSYPNTSKERFRRSFICHYVPRSCVEVSKWYRPLLTFRGEEVTREIATGGGPCGTFNEAGAPH